MPGPSSSRLFLSFGVDRVDLLHSLSKLTKADFAQNQASDITVIEAGRKPIRAGIIADSADDLAVKISQVKERLSSDTNVPASFQTPSGIYFGDLEQLGGIGKIAFLFPGFGSQYPGMLKGLRCRIPGFDGLFEELEILVSSRMTPSGGPSANDNDADRVEASLSLRPQEQIRGIPACLLSSVLLQGLLKDIGVCCDVAAGYSVGELAALICGGYIKWTDQENLLSILQRFGDYALWSDDINTQKAFQRIAVNGEFRRVLPRVLAEWSDTLSVQFDNSAHNAILYGKPRAINTAAEQLSREAGVVTMPLPYMEPLHTPWYSKQAKQLRMAFADHEVVPGDIPLLSGSLLDFFSVDQAELIHEQAGHQWTQTVRFHEVLTRLAREGVCSFVEVGPGAMLTGFAMDTIGRSRTLAVATDKQGVDSVRQLQSLIAQFFLRGAQVRPDGLRKRLGPSSSLPETLPQPSEAQPGMPRIEELRAHFSLMREFLDQQQRLMLRFRQTAGGRTQSAAVRHSSDKTDRREPALQNGPEAPTRSQQSGGQTTVEWSLDSTKHHFLRDHCFGRVVSEKQPELRPLPVLPFTVSVEFMARSAIEVAGAHYRTISAENINSLQWITADTGQLRITVVVREQKNRQKVVELQPQERVFECQLYATAGGVTHQESNRPAITAQIRVARRFGGAKPLHPKVAPMAPSSTPLFNVDELYRYCLFHGPAFQVLKDHAYISDSKLSMTLASSAFGGNDGKDGQQVSQTWPCLMDSTGQMAAVWLLEQGAVAFGSYPSRVASMEWLCPPPALGQTLQCIAYCSRKGEDIRADFDFTDPEGIIVARVRGMVSRFFDFPNDYYAAVSWPGGGKRLTIRKEGLAPGSSRYHRTVKRFPERYFSQSGAIWLRVLAHTCLSRDERAHFASIPGQTKDRRESWLLGRIAAKDVLRDWFEAEHDLRVAPADLELTEGEGLYRARYVCDPEFGPIPPVQTVTENDDIAAILVISDRVMMTAS